MKMMSEEQMKQGMALIQKFLKKIDIEVDGNKVITCYHYEFPDERIAQVYAQSVQATFGEIMEEKEE